MAGNVSGLHVFGPDTGPEALSLLDTNYTALTSALNALINFSNSYIDSGAANALIVTVAAPQAFSYSDGMTLQVKVAATNTSTAPTINVNGLGAKTIVNPDGSTVNIGALVAGGWATLTYEAGIGKFQLVDPGAGATGVGKFADGTAPLPSITFASDTTTGIYKAAAQTLGFATAGVARGSVNGTGNWVVNTPTSGTALTVNLLNNTAGLSFSDGIGVVQLQTDVGHNYFFGSSNGVQFNLISANVVGLRLDTSQNLSGRGPVAGALVDLTPDTGQYVATYVGGTTAPTVTVTWARVGKLVILTIPTINATSNSTSFSLTGAMPAALQPTSVNQLVPVANANDNGVFTAAQALISVGSSTITLEKNASVAGWTAAGNKGVGGTIFWSVV